MTRSPDPFRWQRLSPWAVALMVLSWIRRIVRENLELFFVAGAGFVLLEQLGLRELALGGGVVVVVTAAISVLRYRRFRFRLDESGVLLRQGVVAHREVRIRFDRVLNVSVQQPLHLRPLGLVVFSVETAGGGQREVELAGIPRDLAEAMRARIVEETKAVSPTDPAVEDAPPAPAVGASSEESIHRSGTRDLLLHGLTGNQVWLAAGAVASLLVVAQDLTRRLIGYLIEAGIPERLGPPWLVWPGLLVALLAGLLAAAAVWSWIRYGGFELFSSGERLRLRHGLLERRERTLDRSKLQALAVVRTAAGRLLDREYLLGRQATPGHQGESGGRQRFLVPGLARGEGWWLVRVLVPDIGPEPELRDIDPAYRSVYGLRAALLGAVPGLLPVFTAGIGPWLWLLAILPPLAWGAVHLSWKRWGYRLFAGHLCIRQGLLGEKRTLFAVERVQSVAVKQSPVQRRRDAATLELTLPYGSERLPFLPREEADALANRILHAVETSPARHL